MKMEEDQELKHVCRLCKKSFLCGRSLGGHMRSHVTNSTDQNQEKLKKKKLSLSSINNGGITGYTDTNTGYGLREKPKKTCRFVDSIEEEETMIHTKFCKECGKGFQSYKALFGHMKCHSQRFSNSVEEEEEEEEYEDSWLVMDSQSERRRSSRRVKRYISTTTSFSVANCSSSASEIEQEQEEIAMCLMMLSRDSGRRAGLNSVGESSDNNSEFLEAKLCDGEKLKKVRNGVKSEYADLVSENSQFDANQSDCGAKMKISEVLVDGFVELDKNLIRKSGFDKAKSLIRTKSSLCDGVKFKKIRNGEKSESADFLSQKSQFDAKNSNFGVKMDKSDFDFNGFLELDKNLISKNGFDQAKLGSKKSIFDGVKFKKVRKGVKSKSTDLGSENSQFAAKNSDFGAKMNKSEAGFNGFLELDKNLMSESGFDQAKLCSKNIKFQCTFCNRTFHSYQALGGHRASHKKIKDCFASKTNTSEKGIEIDVSLDPIIQTTNEKTIDQEMVSGLNKINSKGHECPICFKVFSSGQALGGHKRSHLIGGSEPRVNKSILVQNSIQEIRDHLDLNLPAPVEEESNGHVGFKPWWVGSNHKQESLVRILSD